MSLRIAQQIITSTPLLRAVDRIEFLDRGYSHSKKYVLWESETPKYLLRLSDVSYLQRQQKDFDFVRQHYERGVLCHKPHQLGVTEDCEMCYVILGYIPGRNGEDVLPELDTEHQYEIGVAAGKELSKLHQLSCPDNGFDWPKHRRDKYLRYLNELKKLGLTFVSQDKIEKYVEANLDMLDEAPVRFQHDDYHLANLIIKDGKFAGIIDFNNQDWGDPVEDFYKVPWFTAPISTPFARGQVDGYLSETNPTNFWARYNLYVAMQMHSSLIWVRDGYPEDLEKFQGKIKDIVATHDFENSGPPAWYLDGPP